MILQNAYFKLSEFLKVQISASMIKFFDDAPFEILEKILLWIYFLQPIRIRLGIAIVILTGYRSREHELEMGRAGTSQHCFEGEGALDLRVSTKGLTIDDHNKKMLVFAKMLIDAGVGRICYYPQGENKYSFFHIDFKYGNTPTRLYVSDADLQWKQINKEKFFELIKKKSISLE